MEANASLIALLQELQALDRLPRIGYAMRGVDRPESISEHSFHLAFLVWTLATEEGVDASRAMAMALVHDLAEVRTGDLPRPATKYLPRATKLAAEKLVARDLLAPLGDRAAALLDEYQACETREARFVRLCDKVQLRLKAGVYRQWQTGRLDDLIASCGDLDASDFPAVARLLDALPDAEA
ncbi:MAG: HD domain-containing protein [Acidobacteriota bacterium]